MPTLSKDLWLFKSFYKIASLYMELGKVSQETAPTYIHGHLYLSKRRGCLGSRMGGGGGGGGGGGEVVLNRVTAKTLKGHDERKCKVNQFHGYMYFGYPCNFLREDF